MPKKAWDQTAIAIKMHPESGETICPACSQHFIARQPVELYDLSGDAPLCFHCGFDACPFLAKLVQDYYESPTHLQTDDDQTVY